MGRWKQSVQHLHDLDKRADTKTFAQHFQSGEACAEQGESLHGSAYYRARKQAVRALLITMDCTLMMLFVTYGLHLTSIAFDCYGKQSFPDFRLPDLPYVDHVWPSFTPGHMYEPICNLVFHFTFDTGGKPMYAKEHAEYLFKYAKFLDVSDALRTRRILQLKDFMLMSDEHYCVWRKFCGTGLLVPLGVLITARKALNAAIYIVAPAGVSLAQCACLGFEVTIRRIL